MKCHVLFVALLVCSALAHSQFSYVLQLPLEIQRGTQEAVVTIGKKDVPAVQLKLGKTTELIDFTSGSPNKVFEGKIPIQQGKHDLQLWFATQRTQFALDGIIVAEGDAIAQMPSRAGVEFSPSDGMTTYEKPVLQRLAPVQYQDDFARTAAEDSGLWNVLEGNFALNMSLNPGSAQGAFQFWGSASNGEAFAISNSSKWFWRDMRVGVSAILPPSGEGWGIIFAAKNAKEFWRAEFDKNAGKARIIQRKNGKDTIAKEAPCQVRDAWQRAEILAVDKAVTVFYGGLKILKIDGRKETFAGSIGIFLKNTSNAFFDDVFATGITDQPDSLPSPFGPGEQSWSDFSDKNFSTDVHMASWAHPRSFWNDGADNMKWFRSRLFSDVHFQWKQTPKRPALKNARIRIFSSQEDIKSGYLLVIGNGKAILSLDGEKAAEVELNEDISSINADVQDSAAISINGKFEIKCDKLPKNGRAGYLAADFGKTFAVTEFRRPDWRDNAVVSSSHRLDYSFERAPTAWYPQAGDWKATHRWACVPKWSFFAGRGDSGPTGVLDGNTILWNLRKIKGDFDLEIFAAPLEGTPQRAHFTFPLNINLAFAADGENLDAGYNFVNGIYDIPSKLYFGEKLVAENSDRVVPELRRIENAWYHRVTQVWQQFRIQRKNGHIIIESASHDNEANYQPLKKVFDVNDESSAEKASQFALWTWGENGLAVARATLSFQDSDGAAEPPHQMPQRDIRKGGASEPETYTHATNPMPGGHFSNIILSTPFDVRKYNHLSMLVRPGEKTHLSLMLTVNGQVAEVPISAPVTQRQYTFLLSEKTLPPADGKPGWQIVNLELDTLLMPFFPAAEPIIISSIAIASPYDTIEEIAGLGVNRIGATVDYTSPKLSYSRHDTKNEAAIQLPKISIYGHNIISDFEKDFGDIRPLGGRDGAYLLLAHLENNDKALRLLNQNVGGIAGAYLTTNPFKLEAFPILSFDYAIPKGIEVNLLAVTDEGNFEIAMLCIDSSWKVVGKCQIENDGKWHHAEINLAETVGKHLKGNKIIRRLLLASTNRMGSFQRTAYYLDNVNLVPVIASGTTITVTNPQTEAVAFVLDDKADTEPTEEKATNGSSFIITTPIAGSWLHIRSQFKGSWSKTRHMKVRFTDKPFDATVPVTQQQPRPLPQEPPLISYIPSDRLVRNTFEAPYGLPESSEVYGGFETRREAWVLRNTETAATGIASIQMVNLSQYGFASLFFRRAAWDVKRWPCISFNYMFKQKGCALNLTMLVNEAMTSVEWTGKNIPGTYFIDSIVGAAQPFALQDGKWHETSFDLLEMIQKTRFPKGLPPTELTVTELNTWATNHHGGGYVNPHNARVFIDNFTIYSEYGRNPAFEWSTHQDDEGYAVLFDANADTVPEEKVTHLFPYAQFNDVKPGTWYFHVRTKDKSGTWSKTATKQILIKETEQK